MVKKCKHKFVLYPFDSATLICQKCGEYRLNEEFFEYERHRR